MATSKTRLLAGATRVARIGQAPGDDPQTRLRKSALVSSSVAITVLATAWTCIYLALDRPVSALIPFTYQVCTVIGLAWFSRRRDMRTFGLLQVILMLVLPFLLQWSLGGFVDSSAVMVWAFAAPMGAMVFLGARAAWLTFAAFASLTVLSGLLDTSLAASAEPLPGAVQQAFFVLDILGVAFVTFLVLISFVRALDRERDRSDQLLRNMLPVPIAERLKSGERPIADRMDGVTVMFADIVGFTMVAQRLTPARLVQLLDRVFGACDALADKHGLEKIKTIGDCYMAAAGAPLPTPDHAQRAAEMALALGPAIDAAIADMDCPIQMRIGLHSGEVVAGVIGQRKFAWDLWGPAVNLASRLESQGEPGGIQVSRATHDLLARDYRLESRGPIDIKGLGRTETWLLRDRRR